MSVRAIGTAKLVAAILAGLVVAAGAGAYATGLLTEEEGPQHPLDAVPAEADAVAHVDADAGAYRNATVRNVTHDAFAYQSANGFYRGPRLDRWPRAFAEHGATPLADATALTAFVALDDETRNGSYRATVVRADWSAEAVTAAVEAEANVSLRRTTRDGRTLYVPRENDGPVVAVVDGGYAVGTRAAVTDAAAVTAGDADPVRGDVRRRFDRARSGHVTFVYPFPQSAIPEVPLNVTSFYRTEHVTGVYFTNETANGTTLGAELTIYTEDEVAARNTADTVELGLEFYQRAGGSPAVERAVGNVSVATEGSRVVFVYEDTVAHTADLVDRLT